MRAALLLALCLLAALPGQAKAEDRHALFHSVVTTMQDRILPPLLDGLPPEERAALDGVLVRLTPDHGTVTATRDGSGTILLPAGLMEGLLAFIDCRMAVRAPQDGRRCDEHFDYRLDHALVRQLPGAPPPFARGDAPNDAGILRTRRALLMSAVIFVTAREMGYRIIGADGGTMWADASADLELQVDRWAMDRIGSTGETPVGGAAMVLGYLAQLDRFAGARQQGGSDGALSRARAAQAYNRYCPTTRHIGRVDTCGLIRELTETEQG